MRASKRALRYHAVILNQALLNFDQAYPTQLVIVNWYLQYICLTAKSAVALNPDHHAAFALTRWR